MNNPGTELDSMALLSIVMVDLLLLPASTFGAGEEEAKFALALLGAQDIVYTENGNQYKVQYQNEEGSQYQVQGVYDVAADALKCTVLVDEKEAVVSSTIKLHLVMWVKFMLLMMMVPLMYTKWHCEERMV